MNVRQLTQGARINLLGIPYKLLRSTSGYFLYTVDSNGKSYNNRVFKELGIDDATQFCLDLGVKVSKGIFPYHETLADLQVTVDALYAYHKNRQRVRDELHTYQIPESVQAVALHLSHLPPFIREIQDGTTDLPLRVVSNDDSYLVQLLPEFEYEWAPKFNLFIDCYNMHFYEILFDSKAKKCDYLPTY